MSKPLSYKYSGTKGHIVSIASSLPQTGQGLLDNGWKDISHPKAISSGHYTYQEPNTGLRIRYDVPRVGANGFEGVDHFHILNPNATNQKNMYLDKNGNPVRRGAKASHILPKGN